MFKESFIPTYGTLPRDDQGARQELAWKERGSDESSIRARMQTVEVAKEPDLNVVLNSSDIFSARRTSTGRPLSPKLPARPQSLHNEVGDRSSPKASQRQHAHHHRHLLHWDRAHFHLPYFQKRS
uniref:Uncharacterized protein n=1 Tax=Rhodosorus marinus TaxID=101924 RepID=A0A7S3ABZ9_9RHOD